MSDKVIEPDPNDVRIEYTAVSSFHTAVVTFRFTLLGFFVASVGILISGGVTLDKGLLLLGITGAMYVIELRNRVLYSELSQRAMQIEREYWGYKGGKAYDAMFCYLLKEKPDSKVDSAAGEPPRYNSPMVWGSKRPWIASHTKGLDLVYGVIALYALAQVVRHLIP